jgi:hypothetical protein
VRAYNRSSSTRAQREQLYKSATQECLIVALPQGSKETTADNFEEILFLASGRSYNGNIVASQYVHRHHIGQL